MSQSYSSTAYNLWPKLANRHCEVRCGVVLVSTHVTPYNTRIRMIQVFMNDKYKYTLIDALDHFLSTTAGFHLIIFQQAPNLT